MRLSDFEFHDTTRLDQMLEKLMAMIVHGQELDSNYCGLVAACIIDNNNRVACGLSHYGPDGRRRHAERVALDRYRERWGDPESGSICVTTLSPCTSHIRDRYAESCKDLINQTQIRKVYCGYLDPTQQDLTGKTFSLRETRNPDIRATCKIIAHQFLGKI
jgi:pyrimidine deaminase RibD-like protein